MEVEMGNILVYLALLFTLGALLLHTVAAWKGSKQVYHVGLLLNLLALLMTMLVWALLTHYFRTPDLTIEYVHDHVSKDLPEVYKFTGVWAGKVGSFLLWLFGMQAGLVTAQAIFSRSIPRLGPGPKGRRSMKEAEALQRTTSVVGTFMVLLFISIFTLMEPFRPTAATALIDAPDGRGLNILLQHPLMAAHPFLALIGYGIAMVPFVASVSFMLTGNKHWAGFSLPFSRAFFLLFTVALTLGGLWAYNTLGWGGYWAWDPVETSSLLPWLMAAAVCHTQVSYVKRNQSKLLGAMTSYFLLPVILFATFAARSGLWSSVHSYAATPGEFWEVISASGFLSGLLFLTLALIVFGPILLIKAYLSYFDHYEGPDPKGKGPRNPFRSRRNAMLFSNVLILMGLLVIIFIMLLRLGSGLTAGEFEAKLAPLALVLASGQMLHHYGTKRSAMLPFAALAIAIGAGLVSLGLNPSTPIASFSIPFLGVAAAGVVHHVMTMPKARRGRVRLHDAGAPLVHLGVLLMLVGYAGSTFLVHEETVTLAEGTPVEFEEFELVLVHKDEAPEHKYLEIQIRKDGSTLGEARPGLRIIDGQTRSEVSVVKLPGKDLRFVFEQDYDTGEGTRAQVTVRSLPAINLLWGGAFMVASGTALRFSPSGPHGMPSRPGPVRSGPAKDGEE